uniref:Chitin-binding type-2 domain-containing protein n=1 Tax=Glossina morsitans morsitans TaxID=37546 RepID=A0A1B0FMZ8_GLOMM
MFKFFGQLLLMLIISNLSNGRYIEERKGYHLSPPQLPYIPGAMANNYYSYPYGVAPPPYYPHHQANLYSPPGSYFDQRRSVFRPFPGGGSPILIDYHNRCSDNYLGLKPHPTQQQYYYLCKPDCVIFGKCQNLQTFNYTSSQCVHSMPDYMTNCSSMGIFPIYSDCHLYYKCNQQLQAHIYSCPRKTIFSPHSKQCIAGNSCSPTQISENGSLFLQENCEKKFPSCVQNGLFRSPSDCSLYYKCELQNNGIFLQTRFKCPSDMFYDLQRYQCEVKEKVACDCISAVDLVYPKLNYYQFPVMMKFPEDVLEENPYPTENIHNCSKPEDKVTEGSGNEKLTTATTTIESIPSTTSTDQMTVADTETEGHETYFATTTQISISDDFLKSFQVIEPNSEVSDSREEFLDFNKNADVFSKETLFKDPNTETTTDFTTDFPDESSTTTEANAQEDTSAQTVLLSTETDNFSIDSLALTREMVTTTQEPQLSLEEHTKEEIVENRMIGNRTEQPFIEIFPTTNEGVKDLESEELLSETTNIDSPDFNIPDNKDRKTDLTQQHISTTITKTNQLQMKTLIRESTFNIKHNHQIPLKTTTTSILSSTVSPNDFHAIDYENIEDEKAVLDDELIIKDLSAFIKRQSNRDLISEEEGSGEEENEKLKSLELPNENLNAIPTESDVKALQNVQAQQKFDVESTTAELGDLFLRDRRIIDREEFGVYRKPFKEFTSERFSNEKLAENVENTLTSTFKYLQNRHSTEDCDRVSTVDTLKDDYIEIEFLTPLTKNNPSVTKSNPNQSKNNLKSKVVGLQYDLPTTSTSPPSKLRTFQNITNPFIIKTYENKSEEIIYFMKNSNDNLKIHLRHLPKKHHSTHLPQKDTEPVIFTNFSITVTEASNGNKVNATVPRLEIQIEDPLDVHFVINPRSCTHTHPHRNGKILYIRQRYTK